MIILFAHEMGHYLYARRYRVYATPPLFIPCPYLSLFGTLGAFIRIKSSIPSRAALFDIGIAGPIAGFIPACAALLYGLSLSHPVMGAAEPALQLGFPAIFHFGARFLHVAGPLSSLSLHPIASAAWVGMFATALNLLPAGQLDGGHIVFSISPHLHRTISQITVFILLPIGIYLWMGWLIWAVLLFLTMRHPRVPRQPEVAGRRRALALCAALILALTFTPAPLKKSSGRQVWQEIRPQIREWRQHLLRRK
jgi:membrane-associated protease RseP (regulator of RpoE activity)